MVPRIPQAVPIVRPHGVLVAVPLTRPLFTPLTSRTRHRDGRRDGPVILPLSGKSVWRECGEDGVLMTVETAEWRETTSSGMACSGAAQ